MVKLEPNQVFKYDKIELYPTPEQAIIIWKFIEASRQIYNITIHLEDQAYKEFLKGNREFGFISKFEMNRLIPQIRVDYGFQDIPLHICRFAADRAVQAYIYFFKKISNKPKIKRGNYYSGSYDVRCEQLNFWIENDYVKMEGFGGIRSNPYIKCQHRNYDRTNKFYNITVSADNVGRYWLTVAYKATISPYNFVQSDIVGIDIGFREDGSNMVVTSSGDSYSKIDMSYLENRIDRYNYKLLEDWKRRNEIAKSVGKSVDEIPMSNNMQKIRLTLNQSYKKLWNTYNTMDHQIAADIVSKNPKLIVVEDLVASQMAPYINTGNTFSYDLLSKIKEKANYRGIPVLVANKYFPSSKICCRCGNMHEPYNHKIFVCPYCGLHIDRDINATLNLKRLGEEYLNKPAFGLINGKFVQDI